MKTQRVGFNCLHGLLIGSSFSEGALKAASSPQSFAIFASSSCDRYSETEAKTVMRLGWIKIAPFFVDQEDPRRDCSTYAQRAVGSTNRLAFTAHLLTNSVYTEPVASTTCWFQEPGSVLSAFSIAGMVTSTVSISILRLTPDASFTCP